MRRPSHTTVVAYAALFAAVATGGASAAGILGKNDVKSRHIAPAAVKASDLAAVPNGLMTHTGTAFYLPPEGILSFNRLNFGEPSSAFEPQRGTFTAPRDGSYMVVGQIDWSGNGQRDAIVRKNFQDTLLSSKGFSGPGTQTVAGIVRLAEDDNISVWVFPSSQNAGETSEYSLTVAYISG
jgi:hypothetical protein